MMRYEQRPGSGTSFSIWTKRNTISLDIGARPLVNIGSRSNKVANKLGPSQDKMLLRKELQVSQKISVRKTEAALRKMKSGKATGPDDLPADRWKSKGWCPADWMTEFFNQVVA
ncbi:unnamed protein product [Heligmosomoides polygyrus]|uniref:Uncharacterized protein n=1 Tax=Heligmosomoides polygyrus TaxID=6339 RepID=A0A183GG22_HELPZ|nr:unnamed protein product [Heligmosomoides polygyrus]